MKGIKDFWRASVAWAQAHLWTSAAGAAVVLAVLYFAFFSGSKTQAETMVAEPADFTASVSVAGTVVAAHNVDLGFAKGGRISAVYVKAGNQVRAGETLASVENG